jgi:molybdopterin/thiamine biosynthesis adenylyltransferase
VITIIGVGALGSHVALFLRNEKAGLKVVDFDRVESKNTQAQFHTKLGQSKNKALALQQGFQGLFGQRIEAVPHRLMLENAKEVLTGSKLVLDCTDNKAARQIISSFIGRMGLPCLHGALSAAGDFGQVIWDEHFKADAEDAGAGATCIDGEHLPFFALVASKLAIEAQLFLRTGKKRSWQVSPSGVIQVA